MNFPAIWMTAQVFHAETGPVDTNKQNITPSVDSLVFEKEIHTLQTYLRIKLIKRTLIGNSLAGKNTL